MSLLRQPIRQNISSMTSQITVKMLCLIFITLSFTEACQNVADQEAQKRFSEAFPFLEDFKNVWHVETVEGDYVGELNCTSEFLRNGWGEMRWANGTLYGPNNIFIYSQGDRYFGQWRQNKQEGNFEFI